MKSAFSPSELCASSYQNESNSMNVEPPHCTQGNHLQPFAQREGGKEQLTWFDIPVAEMLQNQ
jgi:hypothetical protein